MSRMMWVGVVVVAVLVGLMFAVGPGEPAERLTVEECAALQGEFDVVAAVNEASQPGSDRYQASLARMAGLETRLRGC